MKFQIKFPSPPIRESGSEMSESADSSDLKYNEIMIFQNSEHFKNPIKARKSDLKKTWIIFHDKSIKNNSPNKHLPRIARSSKNTPNV